MSKILYLLIAIGGIYLLAQDINTSDGYITKFSNILVMKIVG